MTLLKQTR